MNAKISVLVICAEAIVYLLLHNLLDCTFKCFRRSWLRISTTQKITFTTIRNFDGKSLRDIYIAL